MGSEIAVHPFLGSVGIWLATRERILKVTRKKKGTYFRLDEAERKSTERGLDGKASRRPMARDLGRSASTIHDEVVRDRVVVKGPGKGDNVSGTKEAPTSKERVCPKPLVWPFCRNSCAYRHYTGAAIGGDASISPQTHSHLLVQTLSSHAAASIWTRGPSSTPWA